ncbi:TIGR03862 family flavoprotein [Caenimonas sedimenti]|uniref:TIGR03862 family flavoprotein n=1 Tax=Caenimonas sedimenti TaxID=2596921 RepID=A0A562ZXW9_9BURK|nr:TIGR03862 family flavoprotein [Caenimonas sedimenti]TWO73178.1 TIGR03862 family flavoprotein [Caenimonas sedimenti]
MRAAPPTPSPAIAVVGGGPAGLMAAERLAQEGVAVDVFDAMPSVGRKFLLAGRGGLNLTHSEAAAPFLARYGRRSAELHDAIGNFDASAVRAWAAGLGIATFVGSSGRVFPTDMKAAPLLRAWLQRLRAAGVVFHPRHRWLGWDDSGALRFGTPGGEVSHAAAATVLALGGASWPRLGSDGAWVPWLRERGVAVAPLQPANCGFDVAVPGTGRVGWSDHLRTRFAGQPVKPVAASFTDGHGQVLRQQGEFVLTETGVEGSLVYAFSASLRDHITVHGHAEWLVDLLPQHTPQQVLAEIQRPRGTRSLSNHLKNRLGVQGLKSTLLHELLTIEELNDAAALARALKALPMPLVRPRPVAEAISTAGGVAFEALGHGLMLREVPGVFCAGEMLDWEAPTGGYLLTACLATGRQAAEGALQWLAGRPAAG